MNEFAKRRERMVVEQIAARGVRDRRVLSAMLKVRREAFVPPEERDRAYDDAPLPIAANQTISQPYVVAYMIEALALKGGEKALEIGAGSGYAAAVLAEIADEVYAVERVAELARNATARLAAEGYDNVHIRRADGTRGWVEHAPFDAILVSAGAPSVPLALRGQLAAGDEWSYPSVAASERRSWSVLQIAVAGGSTRRTSRTCASSP